MSDTQPTTAQYEGMTGDNHSRDDERETTEQTNYNEEKQRNSFWPSVFQLIPLSFVIGLVSISVYFRFQVSCPEIEYSLSLSS